MKKLKCEVCSKEWYIENNKVDKLNGCPFCVASIQKKGAIKEVNSLEKAIYSAITHTGIEILENSRQLSSYLMDIAPKLKKEIRIFSKIFNEQYMLYLKDGLEQEDAEIVIRKLKYLFVENEGLSENWADMVCESLLKAIMNINQDIIENSVKKQNQTIMESPSELDSVINQDETIDDNYSIFDEKEWIRNFDELIDESKRKEYFSICTDIKDSVDKAEQYIAVGDDTNALKYYQQAAEKGHELVLYYYGYSVEENEKEVIKLYLRNLDLEQVKIEAYMKLGEIYYYGCGIEKNEKEALKWLIKSSEEKEYIEQYVEKHSDESVVYRRLGMMYFNSRCDIEKDRKEALKCFIKNADLENSKLYKELGDNNGRNEEEAEKWYFKSVNLGNNEAYRELRDLYLWCDYDKEKVQRHFLKCAERGNNEACKMLREFYYGVATKKDKEEIREWYLKNINQENSEIYKKLGEITYTITYTDEEKEKEGLKWLIKSAKQGNGEACNELGEIYRKRHQYIYHIVKKNKEKALKWYLKGANLGNSKACKNLGDIYYYDWREFNIKQDKKEGLKWYLKSAKQGNSEACRKLGDLYVGELYSFESEYIFVEDKEEVLKWYLKSVNEGSSETYKELGDLYYYGDCAVEEDKEEALKWYLKSAKQGNSEACSKLGDIFKEKGNVEKSFKYYKMAADEGNIHAQYMLCRLGKESYETGVKYLENSAERGVIEAQKLLLEIYDGSTDMTRFIYWLEKIAEQGDIEYKIILANLYFKGKCVKKDFSKVEELLLDIEREFIEQEKDGQQLTKEHHEVADLYCELYLEKFPFKSSVFSIREIGGISFSGSTRRRVVEKHGLAFEHYCKAFNEGDNSVLYNIGCMYFKEDYRSKLLNKSSEELLTMIKQEEKSKAPNFSELLGDIYFNGSMVEVDKSEAESYYLKAKEKGSIDAILKLSNYYMDEKQYEKRFSFLEEAYQKGSVEATRLLGLCYRNGIGVKKKRAKAKQFLREAASKGDMEAKKELDKYIF